MPHGAVLNKKLDRSVCKSCKTKECLHSKKNQGIVCKGTSYHIDQIVEEAMDCSPMYFDNGGITLTGGEPTVQFEAVTQLLTKLKKKGIHTAIETNATHPHLDKVLSLIDQPIIDFKHYDSQIHKEYTCVGNETIKRNIAKVSESQQKAIIRVPLIGGFNAGQKDISDSFVFFQNLITRICAMNFYGIMSTEKINGRNAAWNTKWMPGHMLGKRWLTDSKTFLNHMG